MKQFVLIVVSSILLNLLTFGFSSFLVLAEPSLYKISLVARNFNDAGEIGKGLDIRALIVTSNYTFI